MPHSSPALTLAFKGDSLIQFFCLSHFVIILPKNIHACVACTYACVCACMCAHVRVRACVRACVHVCVLKFLINLLNNVNNFLINNCCLLLPVC